LAFIARMVFIARMAFIARMVFIACRSRHGRPTAAQPRPPPRSVLSASERGGSEPGREAEASGRGGHTSTTIERQPP